MLTTPSAPPGCRSHASETLKTLKRIEGIFGILVRLVVVEFAESSWIGEDITVGVDDVMLEVRWEDLIAAFRIGNGEDREWAEAVGQI